MGRKHKLRGAKAPFFFVSTYHNTLPPVIQGVYTEDHRF